MFEDRVNVLLVKKHHEISSRNENDGIRVEKKKEEEAEKLN